MNIRTDNVVIDEMTGLTQIVNTSLAECNTAFKTIRFFVKKTFANNKAVQNQFGINDLVKVRRNVPKMIVFMQDLNGMVQKHKELLLTAGCNPALIDNIAVLGEKLSQDNVKQEQFKKERGVITQERVNKLNDLYNIMKPISEIAHIIYADNNAKLAIYALPKPKSSNDNAEDILLS